MPSSSEVYPRGQIRFFRLASILHDEGKTLLTLYFKTFYSGKSLDTYLNEPANKTIIDGAYAKKIIHQDQYLLLYPGPTTTTNLHHYDITLLVFLIRSLHPYILVNDAIWTYPLPTDKSIEATVAKLKDIRNKLWGHIYELNITESEYENQCLVLQELLETLALRIGDPTYTVKTVQDNIKDKAAASMDPDAENRLLNFLQSWKKFDNQDFMIGLLDEIKLDLQKVKEAVCKQKEVRSMATSTSDDQSCNMTESLISCSSNVSNETIYEQPVSKVSENPIETDKESAQNAYSVDVSTSTSSLKEKHKLGSRIWAFLRPFIGSPRPQSSTMPHKSYHPTLIRQSTNRPSPLSKLACMKTNRRFARVVKVHTDRHDDLPLRCFISGLVYLSNGLLVVIDTTHKSIQLYDRWHALIDVYRCDHPIKNACAISHNKIAVTLFMNRAVALFEITRKDGVKYLETVNVHCESWLTDIKYRDGKLFTLCDKSEIHVHHFNSLPDDVFIFEIGFRPLSFDVSKTNDRLCLYIAHNDGILCFTESGKELWDYYVPATGASQSFTQLYRHGNKLFVSAWGTNRILELTIDGEWVRDIGVGQTDHPWAVDVSSSGEQMVVSQYSSAHEQATCREVLVFQ